MKMTGSAVEKAKNFSFILPALAIFSIFYLYPFFYTFILSFHRGDAISSLEFVGWANFQDVLLYDKAWWRSVYNAGFITFWALSFQNILAFSLAMAVDKATRTGKIYRIIFFILPVLSEIIIGLLMREMLISDPGILNKGLTRMGLGFIARDWLGNNSVLLTTALVHSWKGFGWAFVIFLAGLQTVPEQLYEAARIDGANAWQTFNRVTLPLLMPVVAMVIVLTILGTMQAFAMILALTRGAGGLTEVPTMRIYNHLRGNQVGLACAEGVILGIILIFVSRLINFISKEIRRRWGVLPT
ncbi:MAG: sugar ABC transporter permease [Candidatus Omnitrophota bacterium]|nr:sugar ABC transporter permease [Candidatus Omnitrophota bacterium]